MKTNKDELLHETLVRYYWRLGCNGAKALVDSVRLHPMVVVFGTIAIIYMYRFRDLSYVSDMGSVGHMIAITDTLAMVALVLMIALVVSIARQSVPGAKHMYENLMRGGVVNSSGEAPRKKRTFDVNFSVYRCPARKNERHVLRYRSMHWHVCGRYTGRCCTSHLHYKCSCR